MVVAPERASAAASLTGSLSITANIPAALSCLGISVGGLLSSAPTSVVSTLSSVPVLDSANLVKNTVSAGANSTDCITTTILTPLARALARMVLQQITASTINWVNGANGSGQAQFVQNFPANQQAVGDAQAVAFFAQIGQTNSPFAAAITSSLRSSYAQQTSSAGFFAANKCTLNSASPNVTSFLAGNWSQGGGAAAWFALTTQSQNNPYTLYQNSQSQLSSLVGAAQGANATQLNWGQGFSSWCGSSGGSSASPSGVAPGAPCVNKNGTPGIVQTPGSIIHGYTQQAVVASGLDQLVSAQDLDSALGAIVTALANQILGGASNGGFTGASQPSSIAPSLATQLQNYSPSNEAGVASSVAIASTTLGNLAVYTSAWQTIATAASTASSTLTSLANSCIAEQNVAPSILSGSANATNLAKFLQASTAEAAAAKFAIATETAPVLAQARAAQGVAAITQAFALQVQSEAAGVSSLTVNNANAATQLANDVQTLAQMPPSGADIVNAQQNAQAFGGAAASPAGSLIVSGGSLVDQMNLITTNAQTLAGSVCNPSSSLYVTATTNTSGH